VLYDANCALCARLAARADSALRAAGFRLEPLQSAWVRRRLNLPEEELLRAMRVLTQEGRVLGGADALVYLAGEFVSRKRPWWAWLLVFSARIPVAMPVLRFAYRQYAARRYCRHGACSLAAPHTRSKEELP
jgi:predicted DCC family thiol-disulfide oxidoreductase YuxK